MAQRPAGRSKRGRSLRFNTGISEEEVHEARDRILNNPRSMECKYAENDQVLIMQDPTLGKMYLRLISLLMNDGLVLNKNGKFSLGNKNFKMMTSTTFLPFLSKAFRQWLDIGYVCFSVDVSDDGVQIPFIPEMKDIMIVKTKKSEKNKNMQIHAYWKELLLSSKERRGTRQPLWVLSDFNLLGIGYDFDLSVLSNVRHLINVLNEITRARVVGGVRNAEPTVYYEDYALSSAVGRDMSNMNKTGQSISMMHKQTDAFHKVADEVFKYEDIRSKQKEMQQDLSDNVLPNDGEIYASASARINIALNEKDNFKSELVPSGMKVTYPPAVSDMDFVNTRKSIIEEITDFFGFGQDEVNNENIRLFYGRILSQIMTVVFDVIYDVDDDDTDDDDDDEEEDNEDYGDDDDEDNNKVMTSVKSTYNEQMKKRYNEDVEQEDFYDDDDGEGDNKRKKDKKKKIKRKNEFGFGAKIDIYLKNYALMYYPIAKQMKEQNIIDEFEFYNKFPLAREIDLQKEQQQMAKQQMKINKESQEAKLELDKKSINHEISVTNQTLKLEQQKQQSTTPTPNKSSRPSPSPSSSSSKNKKTKISTS